MRTPTHVRAARLAETSGNVTVEVCALTDVGRTREHNEDAFVVSDLAKGTPLDMSSFAPQRVGARGLLFMVADGMGGAAAGELASSTAVDVVLRYLRENWSEGAASDPAAFVSMLESATQTANGVIFRYANERVELRGMGTTATIAGLLGDTLYLAQVGDSRAYLVRHGLALQLTKDQSLIQKLVEAGELTEAEAAVSDRRNIILQALGPESQIKIDLTHQRVRRGDVLVLCSDGLSGQVSTEQIAAAVRESRDLPAACERLIDLANDLGGPDNITVVMARFDGAGLLAPAPEDEVGHRVFMLQPKGNGEQPGESAGGTADLETLLRQRTQDMLRGVPLSPFPADALAVRQSRRARANVIRVILLTLAIALGAVLAYRLLMRFVRP